MTTWQYTPPTKPGIYWQQIDGGVPAIIEVDMRFDVASWRYYGERERFKFSGWRARWKRIDAPSGRDPWEAQ